MMTRSIVWIAICFVYLIALGFGRLLDKLKHRYGQHDVLFVARCEARCWLDDDRSSCIRSCLSSESSKLGSCPSKNTTLSPFVAVCLNTCEVDSQCPGLTKCCQHKCGVTCQHPANIMSVVGLPDVPSNVKIKEGKRRKIIYIEWNPGEVSYLDEGGGTILYVIEERHHAGRNYLENRLTEWSLCARTVKLNQLLKHFAKPGRWYQFRVAAVNGNGTRGFSEHSLPFSVSVSPKPPKAPQNVKVSSLWNINGSLTAELQWSPPLSDLPIQKYKIFWSRRLHGAKALDSVLVHQQIVPKEKRKFLLENLQSQSLYFLQVQALSQFGEERLKGEKSGLVLNTTNYINLTDNAVSLNSHSKNLIEGLHLEKLFWSHNSLRARISWKVSKKTTKLTITWWIGSCRSNHFKTKNIKLSATTKATHFDLYDLQFNCKYRVSVKEAGNKSMKTTTNTSLTFTTPTCLDFSLIHKKIKCIQ